MWEIETREKYIIIKIGWVHHYTKPYIQTLHYNPFYAVHYIEYYSYSYSNTPAQAGAYTSHVWSLLQM